MALQLNMMPALQMLRFSPSRGQCITPEVLNVHVHSPNMGPAAPSWSLRIVPAPIGRTAERSVGVYKNSRAHSIERRWIASMRANRRASRLLL
jgi:hypothetical protein